MTKPKTTDPDRVFERTGAELRQLAAQLKGCPGVPAATGQVRGILRDHLAVAADEHQQADIDRNK